MCDHGAAQEGPGWLCGAQGHGAHFHCACVWPDMSNYQPREEGSGELSESLPHGDAYCLWQFLGPGNVSLTGIRPAASLPEATVMDLS